VFEETANRLIIQTRKVHDFQDDFTHSCLSCVDFRCSAISPTAES